MSEPLPDATLRSVPSQHRSLCERVWREYLPASLREEVATFPGATVIGQWFADYAELVVRAERDGHGRASGDVAYGWLLQHSLAEATALKHKWAIQFANCGDPRRWDVWPRFVPTLREAVLLLWTEYCMMPGTFAEFAKPIDRNVRPLIWPTSTLWTPPNRPRLE